MIHLPSASSAPASRRFVASIALVVLWGSLLISWGLRHPESSLNGWLPLPADTQNNAKSAEEPAAFVTVNVNALRSASTDLRALNTTLRGMIAWNEFLPLPDDAPQAGTVAELKPFDWFQWGRMGGARAQVTASLPHELAAYAAQTAEGTTVCITNRSPRRIVAKTLLRLPKGVYATEALSYRLSAGETPTRTALLERQKGRDIGQNGGTVGMLWTLEPGEIVFLRATDEARLARLALNDANALLNRFARVRPSPAKRLKSMLSEAAPYVGGLTGTAKSNTLGKRLNCVHRILLYAAQAQSLHGNYMARGVADNRTGPELMGAFERLTDALAETSATLLGLVPQIRVTFAPDSTSQLAKMTDDIPSDAAPHTLQKATIALSLEHQGGQALHDVKLGVDARNLPSGVTCSPAQPDVFESLRPGQSVRAEFVVQGVALDAVPLRRFVGDISYFTVGAPAHLRPRSW